MALSVGNAKQVPVATQGVVGPGMIALIAVVAFALSGMLGWHTVVDQGLLGQTDAYQRVSRLLASFEAGRLLDHIPRDNAGHVVVLHWSHLLDAVIVLLALPLIPLVGTAKALHYAGAAIGPLALFAAGMAVLVGVRSIVGPLRQPVVVALIGMLGPSVLAYSALGQADHHVLLGALAVLTPALAFQSGRSERPVRCAAAGGISGGLGIWMSPELLPFVLFGWAVAILVDIEHDGRMARRGEAYAIGLLACLVLALAIDPPTPDRFAAESDRMSRPFVELAALMSVAAFLGRRYAPVLQGRWPPALLAGAIAALAFVPWVSIYPAVLGGPAGVFSPEAQRRIWNHISEMRPPIEPRMIGGFLLFPILALVVGCGILLWRGVRPLAVLVVTMSVVVAYFSCRHVRFCVYLHLAAAVVIGVLLERAVANADNNARRLRAVLLAMLFALVPILCLALLKEPAVTEAKGSCSVSLAAPGLGPEEGRVVLTQLNYAPALIYFTRAIAVTGPYHRSERLILAVLDAFNETAFQDAKPASFAATGADAVMVCATDSFPAGSLGAALASGTGPAWLVERPVPGASNFRLFDVR